MAFTWDSEKRKYRDDSGKLVPDGEVHRWLDDLLNAIALLFATRSNDYYRQLMTFDEFFTSIQRDIESLHYAAAAIAFGGFNQMNADDTQQVELFILTQLSFYRLLMTQIFNETVSKAQADARLAMYAFAGWSTYANAVTKREQNAGMLIYRRVLEPGAEHCDDCIEYFFRGWRFIGQLPRIGDSACRTNCRCHFIYSNDLSLIT